MSAQRRTIERLLREPQNVERLVGALFPKAVRDGDTGDYLIADVGDGAGKACIIHATGERIGLLQSIDADGASLTRNLIDAVCIVRDCAPSEALKYIGGILRIPSLQVHTGEKPPGSMGSARRDRRATGHLRILNRETEQRNQRALGQSVDAQKYLKDMGLDAATIAHFRLGVTPVGNAVKGSGGTKELAIASPVLSCEGLPLSRLAQTRTCARTEGSPGNVESTSRTVAPGGPHSTWDGNTAGKELLFVAQSVPDQWRLWQELQGTSLAARMAIVASTDELRAPTEWKKEAFWRPWRVVILGHENNAAGDAMAEDIRAFARRDFVRLEVPPNVGRGWSGFFSAGGTVAELEALIEQAPVCTRPGPVTGTTQPLHELEDGDYEDRRININGAFSGGFMYYPFTARHVSSETRIDDSDVPRSRKMSQYVTRIVRSDGTILALSENPAPRGTPSENRVLTLDDGTEIASVPDPNMFCTWKLSSILSFCDDMAHSRAAHRPLAEILSDLENYLGTVAWLPNRNDYALLAAYAALSYCYNAFEAIPMLFITGEKGSGKSATANALAGVSFNGHVMGTGSEAALIRFADQGRGLLVLDDLERVGRPSKNENGLGGINEILKVSYDKATAIKPVVEKGRIRKLEFFCPKIITNITGIDPVNATRILKISSRRMPPAVHESGQIRGSDPTVSEPLRQELHAWGMAQIGTVHRQYRELFSTRSDRSAQIAAPLLTIAEISGDTAFKARLIEVLDRQKRMASKNASPDELLREAVNAVVARGARSQISLSQIMNELALIPEAQMTDPIQLVPADLAALRDRNHVGRMLRTLGAVGREQGKVNLCGTKARTYRLEPDYVAAALEELRASGREIEPEYCSKDPLRLGVAFCDGSVCVACPYEQVCATTTELKMGKNGKKTTPIRRGSHDRRRG